MPLSAHTARRHLRSFALPGLLALSCIACAPPPQEPTEKPVEPSSTQLRDAIREPLDVAQDAQKSVEQAAAQQRKALEDAGG